MTRCPSPTRIDSGMDDLTYQPMSTCKLYWHVSRMNVVKANSSTSWLVELKLEQDQHTTTTSVDTYTWLLSSIIEPPNHLSFGTGKSTKVLDIISFHEIVNSLTGTCLTYAIRVRVRVTQTDTYIIITPVSNVVDGKLIISNLS